MHREEATGVERMWSTEQRPSHYSALGRVVGGNKGLEEET